MKKSEVRVHLQEVEVSLELTEEKGAEPDSLDPSREIVLILLPPPPYASLCAHLQLAVDGRGDSIHRVGVVIARSIENASVTSSPSSEGGVERVVQTVLERSEDVRRSASRRRVEAGRGNERGWFRGRQVYHLFRNKDGEVRKGERRRKGNRERRWREAASRH